MSTLPLSSIHVSSGRSATTNHTYGAFLGFPERPPTSQTPHSFVLYSEYISPGFAASLAVPSAKVPASATAKDVLDILASAADIYGQFDSVAIACGDLSKDWVLSDTVATKPSESMTKVLSQALPRHQFGEVIDAVVASVKPAGDVYLLGCPIASTVLTSLAPLTTYPANGVAVTRCTFTATASLGEGRGAASHLFK